MSKVTTGLDELRDNKKNQDLIKGDIGYLCHSASLDSKLNFGIDIMKSLFGKRLVKLFGPQHGLVTDVQDNMVETKDFLHPHYQLPVHSLYGDHRIPTKEMLDGIDTLVIDLQDVGTRVYTYINTMTFAMEACAKRNIRVVVLDRPNPVGGEIIEGNLLEDGFTSFVGRHPIPQRHALTIGEMALLAHRFYGSTCDLHTIKMKGWKRSYFYQDTDLHWVLPSPNLPTADGAITFVGTVLYEGTNLSEGRGTTRSLEIIGAPYVKPYPFVEEFSKVATEAALKGFILRPIYFMPTFQKHQGKGCGGFQIHVTDRHSIRPWALSQLLCREFYHHYKGAFDWRRDPYEYEFNRLAIDLINGTDKVRKWVENRGSYSELVKIEENERESYIEKWRSVHLY